MKTTKFFLMAALALTFAACSNDDNDIQTSAQQPQKAEGIPFTATISIGESATTRALSESGTGLAASWAEGEKVALIHNGVNDEMEVTTVYVDKVRFKHLGKRGHCYFHYEVMNGRFHPCGIGKAMNRDGEVTDRYQNVSWQTDSWISPDGTLIPPQLPSYTPPAPASASSANHSDAMQQTLVFSEGEH